MAFLSSTTPRLKPNEFVKPQAVDRGSVAHSMLIRPPHSMAVGKFAFNEASCAPMVLGFRANNNFRRGAYC